MASNHHATVVVVGDRGVLIRGTSGSGKSQLALEILREPSARLVADDQVFLEARGGRLIASAPSSIAGLIEARGDGPAMVSALACAVVDLAVSLEGGPTPRLADVGQTTLVEGLSLPLLRLPAREVAAAAHAVRARLTLRPFVQ